ncbi:hypothetical protein Cgig2_010067 [Carnegiea gigantea]|uniref:Endonuclease/exonuclease/phosphatase domain-containing protein n=1 Tax=Carnegiea gigantea TaxID=171969 RepID=A0A9Q1JU77_9CARY|nr:hypothetical protein Cgig2_010067 [Carnegiea gigantea]
MARGGRRGRPKVNRGQIDGGDHSPLAPSSTIHSVIVESPDIEQQLNETVHEQAHIQPRVLPTYASMVDPDEGTTLEFIQAPEINGIKCAHLAQEDIEEEVNYWKNSVICCILGANPPYDVLAGYLATRHITRQIASRATNLFPPNDLLQLLHGEATYLPTAKNFHITFIYGRNLVNQRLPLWEGLKAIFQSMDDPWCVLGDFNSILHQGDRIGGIDVTEGEIKDFAACIQHCGLQEFSFEGAFFSWTNKQVWPRINKALHNGFWYASHDFTHVHYLPQGLSDHTPIILSFPHCPKPRYTFLFCDIRANDRDIYEQQLRARSQLLQVQSLLQHDPSNMELIQKEASNRDHYIAINHSAMLLIK